MDRIEVAIAKEWLSVADICDYMDVSTFVVTSVLRSGRLPAVKFGREWRVARVDFENWINESRVAGRESRVTSASGGETPAAVSPVDEFRWDPISPA
ncbi:MAG: helix-turn-helix domain-containing protein [Acidimicrobiia bacterium]|nr:helix-turn-helix domain-containing protein [Acidimicrobiia bacterium]